MNDQNFEFYLPEGAQIVDASAETAGGQPINSAPVPQKDKNRYAFIFPLRPGQTLFQVGFRAALQRRGQHRSQSSLPGSTLCGDAAQNNAVCRRQRQRVRVQTESARARRDCTSGIEHRTWAAPGVQDFGHGRIG